MYYYMLLAVGSNKPISDLCSVLLFRHKKAISNYLIYLVSYCCHIKWIYACLSTSYQNYVDAY
jgi:hypothetical protein